ncbi:2-hydroxyacid dehydrogenase [Methanoregula sp. UBA64]|jgi:phosphoglycerate dehydrogenase-like enzyme|uniref:2-hydroxyacid dehydrogenase n=1 Tax=Methanoregula sp. UBA64 TaxID=1915554 RepID=UPI0025E9EE80|nr:2-hydroxyacid dehydrogenase [Methanoregula sp. UBA64]
MKILFCGEGFPEARRQLAALLPDDKILALPPDRIGRHIADADIVVPTVNRVDETLMQEGHFGLIQQFGVGLEGVDITAATKNGIWVARVPSEESGNAASVAEHAILLMLMLSKRWNDIIRTRKPGIQDRWGTPTGQALREKTVCIVGLGGIGRELARRLVGFRVRIVTADDHPGRTVPGVEIARQYPLSDLPAAFAEADYIVLCLNYTPDRFHLVGSTALAAAKPGAYLVNVARGGLLDEDTLLTALKSGQVAGAGLDVFWQEPVDMGHPLFSENVIATPHIAGVTDVSYEGIARAFAGNVKRYAAGETPLYLANAPEKVRHR